METALEDWLECGIGPQQIVATRPKSGVVDRLRPLCPYPQVSVHKDEGDPNR